MAKISFTDILGSLKPVIGPILGIGGDLHDGLRPYLPGPINSIIDSGRKLIGGVTQDPQGTIDKGYDIAEPYLSESIREGVGKVRSEADRIGSIVGSREIRPGEDGSKPRGRRQRMLERS
jgi:hypothetical protein